MKRVGLREARQRFSRLIRAVQRGEEIVLTDRGKPFAKITPVEPVEDIESALDRMAAMGQLRRATARGPMPPFKPIKLRGKSTTQILREMRDED